MSFSRSHFPQGFLFGAATAAYQIEGHAAGGAGESIWDHFAQQGGTHKGENGAIACDHYHRYADDLDLMCEAGFDAYRFSFSWSRLFPDGRQRNAEGFDFYDRLIDAMLERELRPFATAYHWDMPQALGRRGGWAERDNAKRFADVMGDLARRFGDRLESLASINEPWCVSWLSHYIGEHAPGVKDLATATRTLHNVLLAHGLGVQAARSESRLPLGIVLNYTPGEIDSDHDDDVQALARHEAINNEWFLSAIATARYPDAALERLADDLPEGWQDDMQTIATPIDFTGINFYTSVRIAADASADYPHYRVIERGLDRTDMGWEIDPDSLGRVVDQVADALPDLPIYITENGMASRSGIHDADRIDYFDAHLAVVADAAKRHPIKGYFVWSLLDNFEWAFGYSKRFGIVAVDYDDQSRTPKDSYGWWQRGLQGA